MLHVGNFWEEILFFQHDDTDSLGNDSNTNETTNTAGTDSTSTSTGVARFVLKLQENNGEFAFASVTSNSATMRTSGVDLDLIRFLGKEVLPFITKSQLRSCVNSNEMEILSMPIPIIWDGGLGMIGSTSNG